MGYHAPWEQLPPSGPERRPLRPTLLPIYTAAWLEQDQPYSTCRLARGLASHLSSLKRRSRASFAWRLDAKGSRCRKASQRRHSLGIPCPQACHICELIALLNVRYWIEPTPDTGRQQRFLSTLAKEIFSPETIPRLLAQAAPLARHPDQT